MHSHVKDEAAIARRDDDFATHDLSLEVGIGSLSLHPGQASSPVRLCNRPLGRQWLVGACGASSSSHLS
jgi:hypothetical protein